MTLPAEISLGTVGGSRPTRFSQTTSTVSRSALGERSDAQTIQPLMPHVTCWNPVVNGSEDRSGLLSSGRNPTAFRRKLPRSRLLARVVGSPSWALLPVCPSLGLDHGVDRIPRRRVARLYYLHRQFPNPGILSGNRTGSIRGLTSVLRRKSRPTAAPDQSDRV
jgi:hypothetical protein